MDRIKDMEHFSFFSLRSWNLYNKDDFSSYCPNYQYLT